MIFMDSLLCFVYVMSLSLFCHRTKAAVVAPGLNRKHETQCDRMTDRGLVLCFRNVCSLIKQASVDISRLCKYDKMNEFQFALIRKFAPRMTWVYH